MRRRRASLLLLALATFTACTHKSRAHPEIDFIQFRPAPNRVVLLARLDGQLILQSGCLALRHGRYVHIIIWPTTTSLLLGHRVGVLDGNTGKRAYVGDYLTLTGGDVDVAVADIVRRPKATCLGSGFATGDWSHL